MHNTVSPVLCHSVTGAAGVTAFKGNTSYCVNCSLSQLLNMSDVV